ncbi:MAG TPA: EthD family reductase [Steroidobacteraceae bacterium]|nr:EthD family reductase [Steroidobacteraceae bacterium]
MITVNVLYPNKDGARFDMSYYLGKHIPMVKKLLGSALKGAIVEQGLGGGAPGTKAEYTVICHLRFDSVEAFQGAFGPHASTIQSDVRNYSSVEPVVQVSEVKLS